MGGDGHREDGRLWNALRLSLVVTMPTMPSKAETGLSREVLGARLRAEREARRWTFRKLAEKLSHASSGICDVPDIESIIPQIRRWERGVSGISEHYRSKYSEVG
jgi:hypothetical protein